MITLSKQQVLDLFLTSDLEHLRQAQKKIEDSPSLMEVAKDDIIRRAVSNDASEFSSRIGNQIPTDEFVREFFRRVT